MSDVNAPRTLLKEFSNNYEKAVASLVRGMGGDGHGSEAACHGSLVNHLENVLIQT